MAKRCTNIPAAQSACCVAAQRGLLNAPFTFTDSRGTTRCGQCSVVPSRSKRHPGQPVFHFQFMRRASCGLGPGGCPALAQAGGGGQGIGGGILTLPPGGVGGVPVLR